MKRKSLLKCFLFVCALGACFACQLLLPDLQGRAEAGNILITNFINLSGYSGDWDLENEIPGQITEELVRRYQEIPVFRKRSWKDRPEDLRKKFPGFMIITGEITDFGYNDNTMLVWPVMYKTTVATVEIKLDIITDEEIYTQTLNAEAKKDGFELQLFGPEESGEEKDELAGVKFGDAAFWNILPGKAIREAIDKCMKEVDVHLPKEQENN
ncbi:hypothetical protein COY52_01580 [Candidatus Desantisbacteria bacterium CG_4_10_14_0_8_um_filter_48_22]|uniref:DUF4136 domain-containing protein n=1 Tax=Candidatus Desantisbacteria bacterium CG_4_10_14_0_8_um_filter_48_22 TaxID=1974543 RepID=A0A2M7SFG8_9BACT|nr:MAG: hypothetical protein AUJ67_01595 [Candidatus Desantisbacteria bacterium CG1_02_49_89]PIV56377.1 MAG: hypothetical protein COS16_04175 [Candidatus Desantisbacteria bacterium CG02_land_8_20_14_3_00_49_13]PIZ18033.1 MAG: hypothetical protein COY52_01580 [Candidatus Desantisbacteria bacterium CG_4_10_14_0_8_um_filter_48_22]